MSELIVGLAGHGSATEENIRALLDKNMPEDLDPYTTERVARGQAGLKTALAWFESEGVPATRTGAYGASDDLLSTMRARSKEKGWPAVLIMLYDPENTEDQGLVGIAHRYDIMVKDLCQAYDDILPVEPETPKLEETQDDPPWEQPLAEAATSLGFTDAEVRVLKSFAKLMLSTAEPSGAAEEEHDTGPDHKPASEPGEGKVAWWVTDPAGDEPTYHGPARGRKPKDAVKVYLTEDEVKQIKDATE
jgi:hypothetical protein